jgi:hypothetical protein
MNKPPDRLTVPTCIGCGAMGEWGTCETGCVERRLDLVRADAYDQLVAGESEMRGRVDALRRAVEDFANEHPAEREYEAAYRAAQIAARAALRATPVDSRLDAALAEPAEPTTTWWCERCGAIDAPQPCLGICIWKPVEWVSQSLYADARDRTLHAHDAEQRLRQLLRRLASVTPRPGQWEPTWHALHADARRVRDGQPPGAGGTFGQPK